MRFENLSTLLRNGHCQQRENYMLTLANIKNWTTSCWGRSINRFGVNGSWRGIVDLYLLRRFEVFRSQSKQAIGNPRPAAGKIHGSFFSCPSRSPVFFQFRSPCTASSTDVKDVTFYIHRATGFNFQHFLKDSNIGTRPWSLCYISWIKIRW